MASKEEVNHSSDPRRVLGKRGEDIAADFFIERGFEILARNWRCRYGEIDLVIKKGDEIRIVEVKTRKSLRVGLPEDSVTEEKLERINDIAHCFFSEKGIVDPAFHIDALSIIFRAGEADVKYLPDVE
jgi:putative endonuclease